MAHIPPGLSWCPNCNQAVSPQKKGSGGSVGCLAGLVLLGIVLLFVGIIPGLLVLGFAAIYFVAFVLAGLLNMAVVSAHCPICKATNLVHR
jgi:hypothetical protein